MDRIKRITKTLFFALLFLGTLSVSQSYAQTYNLNNGTSKLTVSGTSSLHDWDIDAEQQKGQMVLDRATDMKIEKLSFEVTAESLKSGKGGMDKNTYKALNTKKNKSITFHLTEVKKITPSGTDSYNVEAAGDLTVAGVTKRMNLNFDMAVSPDKVTLNGKKSFKMTDFGITPPKALLGTITTGDQVTISFNSIFNK